MARDGKGLRQITRAGNNTFPNWSTMMRNAPRHDATTMTSMRIKSLICICLLLLMGAAACRKSQPPVARPTPPAPPPSDDDAPAGSAGADARADAAGTAAGRRVPARSLDDLNRDSPLRPVFFDYDSSDVNDAAARCFRRTRRC